jgi:hypothetical protein
LAIRHAPHELDASPGRARETLDAAVSDVASTIEELCELARGLPPAQLDIGCEALTNAITDAGISALGGTLRIDGGHVWLSRRVGRR